MPGPWEWVTGDRRSAPPCWKARTCSYGLAGNDTELVTAFRIVSRSATTRISRTSSGQTTCALDRTVEGWCFSSPTSLSARCDRDLPDGLVRGNHARGTLSRAGVHGRAPGPAGPPLLIGGELWEIAAILIGLMLLGIEAFVIRASASRVSWGTAVFVGYRTFVPSGGGPFPTARWRATTCSGGR